MKLNMRTAKDYREKLVKETIKLSKVFKISCNSADLTGNFPILLVLKDNEKEILIDYRIVDNHGEQTLKINITETHYIGRIFKEVALYSTDESEQVEILRALFKEILIYFADMEKD